MSESHYSNQKLNLRLPANLSCNSEYSAVVTETEYFEDSKTQTEIEA